ncbi:asparagine synthase (glutamine-hydrolyzing) [Sphingomonas sp. HT-1]|uniref:asparagine synthase (glutamine-hydrolyzing) n=1 Tax=unclassified Sphingomonas TaxID=196159 RepID=UPI00031317CD|nr:MULTISPECIES: asparagine synthase (glutamine-hydrolyzing) [unclassified Sphingomonas]KTF70103.1 asparagine synthetase B [Sphingomonas sp. WG]
MSGIVGMFYPGMAKPIDPARIVAMREAIAHRGRDGSGVWCVAGVGLGHRRLATIDVAGGVQPMALPDQRLAVVLDGAIYNFRAVRAELEARGACFTSESDVEVLLHGWRVWGPEMLPRLNGAFAFALYDADRQSLFLARDRLGEKPLHIAELADGAIAFASELKGLLAHPMLRRAADIGAVEAYIGLGYVPDAHCLVAGVEKLAAGHFLLVQRGRPVPPPVRWWDIDFSRRAPGRTRDLKAELLERLRGAVRLRMASEVPSGALLTGSIESAGLVALMADASKAAVQSCTIEEGVDGESRAQAIARRFATRHRSNSAELDPAQMLEVLASAFDEPLADASAPAAYALSALARESMTVALSGEGAAAVLAGQCRARDFARQDRVRGLLPADLRARLFGAVAQIYPDGDAPPQPLRLRPMLEALAMDGADAYARMTMVTRADLRTRLFSDAARQALEGERAEALYARALRAAPARSALDRARYADIKLWLPGSRLAQLDRTSMAAGLEARAPLLDHTLVEFVATLPEALRSRGQGRWLLRRALDPWLPRAVLRRPSSAGVAPLDAWLRTALAGAAGDIARSSLLMQTGWFDLRMMSQLADDHRAGRANHGALLWQLLLLERAMTRLFA